MNLVGNRRKRTRGFWWAGVIQDLRVGWRRTIRAPGFTVVAVISIAIGVGSNTILFMVVRALSARPPAYTYGGRMVDIQLIDPSDSTGTLSYAAFRKIEQATAPLVVAITASTRMTFELNDDTGRRDRVMGELVADSYFRTFGTSAQSGRLFGPNEKDDKSSDQVAVISDEYWRRAFLADPDAVGRTIHLNGLPYRIAGVAGREFKGFFLKWNSDVWVRTTGPLLTGHGGADPQAESANESFKVKARLPDKLDRSEIDGLVNSVTDAFRAAHGNNDHVPEIRITRSMVALFRKPLYPVLRPVISLVVVAAILPFFVACVNLAGFLLARAERRGPEAAVLIALGAGRGRIIRSRLVETTMVALLGGCLAVVISLFPTWILADTQLLFRQPELVGRVRLDATVVIFALGLSVLAGLALGLTPAPKPTRGDGLFALGGQGTGRITRTSRMRSAVVVGQVAGTVVLLVAAGLFVRSLRALERADPGFGPNPAAIAWIEPLPQHTKERNHALFNIYLERLSAHPQVVSAGLIETLPLEGFGTSTTVIRMSDAVPSPGQESHEIRTTSVGGDYFDVMGIALIAGRFFDERDRADAAPVAIASKSMAMLMSRNGKVVGRSYRTLDSTLVEIVGVVADTRAHGWSEPSRPLLYTPVKQSPFMSWRVVARTVGDPASIVTAMRDLTAEMDYEMTLTDAKTMEEYLSFTRMPAFLPARMLISLSLLALVLAAVGLFGIVSYNVAARTREMAIRMSVGAAPIGLVGLALRSGLKLVVIGLVIGLPLAAALADRLRGYLYGVDPLDPLTFACVVAVVTVVTALAAYLSARHANRIDPIQALRAG